MGPFGIASCSSTWGIGVFATIVDSLAVEFMSVEVLLCLCGFVLERVVPCYHAVEKSLMM